MASGSTPSARSGRIRQMRRVAFPNESPIGLLPIRDVAVATLRLIQSDLTGQILDVRRHDAVAQAAAEPAPPADAVPSAE